MGSHLRPCQFRPFPALSHPFRGARNATFSGETWAMNSQANCDYLVFVGRFQPLHNGHVHVINEALKHARKVIVLVGSSNVARSPRNPFTYDERRTMIESAARRGEIAAASDRVLIRPLPDFAYNDPAWIAHAQRIVDDTVSRDRGS